MPAGTSTVTVRTRALLVDERLPADGGDDAPPCRKETMFFDAVLLKPVP
jgi:hypothetical protein